VDRDADVVVVGAGFAGLAAARALDRAGARVLVLEARERAGGRTENAEIGDGRIVEIGGQWVGPTQDRIAALAAEVGVGTFPTYSEGANLLRLDGRLRRYSGTIPRLGPLVLLDIARALKKLEGLAKPIDPEAPWESPGAARLDATSLGAWVERNMHTSTAKRLLRVAGRTIWGAEPEELSLLHVAFYLRSSGGFEMLTDVEGGAQQDRLVGGPAAVVAKLAEQLGERLVLGAPVTRIAQDAEGATVIAAGTAYAAGRVIVAIPPALTATIEFEPAASPERIQLAQRLAPGWLVKTTAIYERPFWREDGLSGEALNEEGPVTTTFDNSPPEGTPGALVGFVGGRDARKFARLTTEERRAAVLRCFEALFGARAREPELYLERDWAAERWSGGGPVANFASGGWTACGSLLREPAGRLHWAGTETATRWAGYIDGAVSSGERAAAEVLAAS
jgi:monoamine oxidase